MPKTVFATHDMRGKRCEHNHSSRSTAGRCATARDKKDPDVAPCRVFKYVDDKAVGYWGADKKWWSLTE